MSLLNCLEGQIVNQKEQHLNLFPWKKLKDEYTLKYLVGLFFLC